jgi:hypothetical protein
MTERKKVLLVCKKLNELPYLGPAHRDHVLPRWNFRDKEGAVLEPLHLDAIDVDGRL